MLSSRGQSAIEFLLICSVVVAVVAGVLLPLFRESELSTAVAAARTAMLQQVSQNSSLSFTSVSYAVSGTKVTISPNVYFKGAQLPNAQFSSAILSSIANVFSPSRPPTAACVPALYYTYCVS